jgi:hypothetical protein
MSRVLSGLIALAVLPVCAQVQFHREGDQIHVDIDGKPYTTFYLAPGGNKPYVYPLSTADGIVVTRHFPMEQFSGETKDHPHQRGLFFAHGDINGYNFWATEPNSKNPKQGRMQLVKVTQMKGGKKSGTIQAVFDGQDPAGKPIMRETRTVRFHSDAKLRIIDYQIDIDPLEKLTFGDTKEGTFGIRLATSMTEDKGKGEMVNAEGAHGEKQVWGKRSPWVDYSGPVDDKTVGVAIFDNPRNPRYPTYWHSRAYGLFAANIFGVHDFTNGASKDGALTIEPGHPLRFRYRVVIHPGDAQEAHIADLFKQYSSGS